MAGRCGCGSSACSCLLVEGAGIDISGTGSASNPYVISTSGASITVLDTPSVDLTLTGLGVLSADVEISPDAGNQLVENLNGLFVPVSGTPCPAPMTIAALVALETAGTLDPCTTYRVSNWTLPSSLPGPNVLVARATSPTRLSPFVLVHTPLGAAGPDTGEFLWASATMIQLSDPSGNDIRDVGASGTLDAWVWGNVNWVRNKVVGTTFTGGYAVTSAAAAAGVIFTGNSAIPLATLNLTGTISGTITNNSFGFTSVEFGDTPLVNRSVIGEQSTSSTSIINSGTLVLEISDSKLLGGTYTMSSGGSLTFRECFFSGSLTNIETTTVDELRMTQCEGMNASINSIVAGTANRKEIEVCRIHDSGILFTGATNIRRRVRNSELHDSSINVSVANTSPLNSVTTVSVEQGSVLNVSVSGVISLSRVAGGANLTTGDFTHSSVIIEGQFVTTLTAANVNRLQNKGFSDVI